MPKIDMLAQFFTEEVCKPKKTAKRKPPKKEVKKRQPKKPAPKKKQAAPKKEKPKKVNGMTVGTVYHYDEDGKRTVVRRDRKVRRVEKAPPPPPEKKKRKPRKWKPIIAKEIGEKQFAHIRKIAKRYQKRCDELDKTARQIVKDLAPYLNAKTWERIRGFFYGNAVSFYIQEWHDAFLKEMLRQKAGQQA